MKASQRRLACLVGCLFLAACAPDDKPPEKIRGRVSDPPAKTGGVVKKEPPSSEDGRLNLTVNGHHREFNAGFSLLGPDCKPLQIAFTGLDLAEIEVLKTEGPAAFMDASSFSCTVNWDDGLVGVGRYAEPYKTDGPSVYCQYKPLKEGSYDSGDEANDLEVVIESLSSTRLTARFHGSVGDGQYKFSGDVDAPRKDDTPGPACE